MPLSNDITLNGVAYSVTPGTYRKRSNLAGAAPLAGTDGSPTAARRRVLAPFTGGTGRALREWETDGGPGWSSLGVGPTFDGQGSEPFPRTLGVAGTLLDLPSTTVRAYGAIAAGFPYVGIGRRLYKGPAVTAGAWSDWTVATDLGAGWTISGLAHYQDNLLILLSTGQDILKYVTSSGGLVVWRTNEKGQLGVGYKGQKKLDGVTLYSVKPLAPQPAAVQGRRRGTDSGLCALSIGTQSPPIAAYNPQSGR